MKLNFSVWNGFLFGFILWLVITPTKCYSDDQWPLEYRQFLEPLTYSDAEWSALDFGKPPSKADQRLLKRYQPRLYVAPNGLLPIDFYQDYLPNTVVNDVGGIINKKPNREYLKSIERQFGYYLDYQGEHLYRGMVDMDRYQGSLYGRIFTEKMEIPNASTGNEERRYFILKYNAIFSASGLPGKLQWYKNWGVSLAGDKDIWHELDIHGAIQILINSDSLEPEILLLAQHNHFRSYVIGKDLMWPKDNRISICFAQRSNEPYPCPMGNTPQYFRTVGSPGNFSYVLTGEGAIFDGSEDVVFGEDAGAVEVKYQLRFLPDKDPLYVSWIPLGDKLKLFGLFTNFYRTGPPGINMNTHPALKKYTDLAKFWYFKEDDIESGRLFKKNVKGFDSFKVEEILRYHGKKLFHSLAKSRKQL